MILSCPDVRSIYKNGLLLVTICLTLLHCALAAAQCIVIGPVCGCVTAFVGLLPR